MAYQCRGDAREMRKLEKGEARRLEFPPESFSAPGEPLLTDEDEQDYRQYENAVFVEKSAESGSLKIWYKTYFPASEGDITCIIVGYHPYISNSEYLMKNHARCLRHFEKAAVILFDQPSCGRSDGLWGFMPSWEDHVALTEKFVRKVVVPLRDRITSEQHKFIPIYGFGEDIGANVLATSALRSPDIYNGIILASPFIRDGDAVKAGGFANFLAKCEGSIFPKYPGAPLKEALDKRFVDKDFSDYTSTENKLMWRMPLRMKTNKSIKQGQKWLEKHSAELTTPILILQSSNDKITSPDGSKLLYDLCGSKDKCIKMYDDCPEAGLKYAHELLSAEPAEMSKPVYNDITTWFLSENQNLLTMGLCDRRNKTDLTTGAGRRLAFQEEGHPHPDEPLLEAEDEKGCWEKDGMVTVKQKGQDVQLWYRIYNLPEGETPSCIIIGYHGYSDHSDFLMHNHARVLRHNNKALVVLFDQPSSGRSDGLWWYIPSWEEHIGATEQFIDKIAKPLQKEIEDKVEMKVPMFALGVSLGGGLVCQAAIRRPEVYDGVILVSPMVKVDEAIKPPKFVEVTFRKLGGLMPKMPITPTKDILDKCFVYKDWADYARDNNKLLYPSKPRLGTAIEILFVQDWLCEHMEDLKTPVLILHGKHDQVTSCSSSEELFRRCSSEDKKILIYDSDSETGERYTHVIFGGQPACMSKKVFDDVRDWLNERNSESLEEKRTGDTPEPPINNGLQPRERRPWPMDEE
ncbi:hypothetical protein FOL47_000243 [Perkinsus chesapeaki]|uniref:Serine aminopeptidase S33 domain-containing protein n=1 Tax=Perkinsus chesapeaki TaxID=330153 RepID=A0A7J6MM64_PERCH|nr:hypothetical protein FOL47_000243 [Perkinsus chesapeaki]